MPQHRHRRSYGTILTRGEYLEKSVDGVYVVRAGDIVIHPGFHAHSDTIGRKGIVILKIALPWDYTLGRNFSIYRYGDVSKLSQAIKQRPGQSIEYLIEAVERSSKIQAIESPQLLSELAERWRYEASLSVASAARGVGVTPEHLCRIFGAHFGVSPSEYRLECRFRRAADLVFAGHAFADAATVAGYADQSHMSRDFRRRTGLCATHARGEICATREPTGAS